MNLFITAFTRRGGELARRLGRDLADRGHVCALAFPPPLAEQLELTAYGEGGLSRWTAHAFAAGDGLLFVGACGIAVRAVAPYIKDKFTDPAVVAVDEAGTFAVPLLSGHVGGANDLARLTAELTGGTAVVSTATDVNGLFAVDEWARKQGLVLVGREEAKHLSAALLAGEPVGFQSDFPIQGDLPPGLTKDSTRLGLCITLDEAKKPFEETLRLIPRVLTLGIGCRRGTPEEDIEGAVRAALRENRLSAQGIQGVCSIDLKKDELGLLAFCRKWGWPLKTFSAEDLMAVPGDFTPSEFVRETTGADNICERAAVLGGGIPPRGGTPPRGGALLVGKRAEHGVTVAIAAAEISISFGEEN